MNSYIERLIEHHTMNRKTHTQIESNPNGVGGMYHMSAAGPYRSTLNLGRTKWNISARQRRKQRKAQNRALRGNLAAVEKLREIGWLD
jgi:hypothetical protein